MDLVSKKVNIRFTKAAISALPTPPKGKRKYYYDNKTRGLTVAVTDKGTKTFVVYRKISGCPERIRLGRFPHISIENARKMADEINGAIATGKNPQDAKRAARREVTFESLFNEYMENHAIIHKKAWREDQGQFDRYLTQWSKRKLSAIKKKDIKALHIKIGKERGHYAANRLLALLQTVFNKAIEWSLWEKVNPASGINRFQEKSRERFLQADEFPKFFKALNAEQNDVLRDYFLLSLLTGARRSNVLAMRWKEINLDRATWTIPETKNGSQQTIPLTHEAVDILTERRRLTIENSFVFPGKGVRGHLVEPKKAWKRILDRAGLENLRIHDLRRTLGSWQASTGASLSVIGKTLNHKDVSTTAIYARLSIDPVRQAMETATQAMFQAGGVLTSSNSDENKQ